MQLTRTPRQRGSSPAPSKHSPLPRQCRGSTASPPTPPPRARPVWRHGAATPALSGRSAPPATKCVCVCVFNTVWAKEALCSRSIMSVGHAACEFRVAHRGMSLLTVRCQVFGERAGSWVSGERWRGGVARRMSGWDHFAIHVVHHEHTLHRR